MNTPGLVRVCLAALLFVQGIPELRVPPPVRAPDMACCRMRGHHCGGHGSNQASRAAALARAWAAPPGACVLDACGCHGASTAGAIPVPAPGVLVSATGMAPPRRFRGTGPVPEHVDIQAVDPPLPPPPRG